MRSVGSPNIKRGELSVGPGDGVSRAALQIGRPQSVGAYDADAATYFAARATDPGVAYKAVVNNVITQLKAQSLWTKIGGLYFYRDPTSRADSRINVKLPGTNDITESGTLTWAANKGFTGDGVTAYLDTGYVVPGGSQNDFHAGLASDSSAQGAGNEIGTDTTVILQSRTASDGVLFRTCTGTNASASAQLNGSGHYILSRTAAGAQVLYQEGSSRVSSSQASTTPSGATLKFLGRSAVTSSAKRASFAHFGIKLTAGEAATLSDILFTYYTKALGEDVVAYGDSLTVGTVGGGTAPYPATLATLTGKTVFNGGVAGQVASLIDGRWQLDFGGKKNIAIFWGGRNDAAVLGFTATVLANVASMVARTHTNNPDKYLVIGITGGWSGTNDTGSALLNEILDYNAQAAALYGAKFFDAHAYLYGLGAFGQLYADPVEWALGRIPTALRGDGTVHFNDLGNTVIANRIYAIGQGLGYWT